MDAVAEFQRYRPLLLGLAYRLLGSAWDAEDVVQEAYLRWMRADPSEIREPRSFLITVTSRLALDQLRSARVRREAYPGPWLPEPVDANDLGPMDSAELRDSVSFATLHLMERLSPPERAVFVLREAFGLSYDEIAEIIGSTSAACRQAHHRATQRLADDRHRFQPSRQEHARLLTGFLDAARTGDLAALTRMLSEDVVVYNDGGGRVRAARRPIFGRDKVSAFAVGLLSRYPIEEIQMAEVNGGPAAWIVADGQSNLVTLAVRDGKITAVYGVLNPDKLARIGATSVGRPGT
ncbi:MAG TPA: RNA polymerase sigma-70 factor [Micromonosporaceae bacterium]